MTESRIFGKKAYQKGTSTPQDLLLPPNPVLQTNFSESKFSTDSPFRTNSDLTSELRDPEKSLCSRCLPPPRSSLENLIWKSPYLTVLQEMRFVELNDTARSILNTNWSRRPELKHACVKMLAGCILLKPGKQAALAAYVEVYCRAQAIDIYEERTEQTIDDATCSMLPISVQDPQGSLKGFEISNSTGIFLNQNSIDEAQKFLNKSKRPGVGEEDQILQLRSNFHHIATCFLSRAPSTIVESPLMQPLTLFMLAESQSLGKGTARIAAELSNEIAENILKNEEGALF
ncbi:hypothetical protein BX616_008688 [Lobosporangium transversale]|uniref:Uncharacterized protein n=1 Tax=Lobosporangium transversale TaxID=64571 RepID=A0A1Y2GGD1_9FUNG|nr:hypothetical protein BCR41DRAFT_398610 [Lobosporangium transversale]KAF9914240.1 hypothetical protein BX616_008688 [Lobosporangium transversale]ORZ10069.1 hypothetical protein BCR41DRAFT_398610 [Lobosporangium transversale]|eukprot:XP_021879159.1 hypothetical protein BCR41DRAFT_398610 [Lobosporangium transversale]